MIRQRLRLRFFALFLAPVLLLGVLPRPARAEGDLSILWIGNSYTYYHNLPKMVAELARAGGRRKLVQDQQTPGGCTLEKHWKDGVALKKIRTRPWDFVVLQEHSLRPVNNREAMNEYARKFDAEIRKRGGKTLLYLTWAYQHTPQTQGPITRAHLELAEELKVGVVPVGVAWERVRGTDGHPALFESDKVHPNPAGTYLTACVFYSTLFGKSPEGLPGAIGGLRDEEARKLQKIAWRVVQDRKDVGRTPPPAGASALFNGKDLGGWVKADGKTPAHWKVLPGGVLQVEKGGSIVTTKAFDGPFRLHVEFRVPYLPDASGQRRGNSGVYVQGRYEVQILDSYGLASKADDCGAIYGIAAPRINACKAPAVWQSYDVEFQPPRCKDGKKIEPAVLTVFHNGVKIHDRVKLGKDNTIGGLGGDPCKPGPIMLQEHASAVQFRNLWLVPLK